MICYMCHKNRAPCKSLKEQHKSMINKVEKVFKEDFPQWICKICEKNLIIAYNMLMRKEAQVEMEHMRFEKEQLCKMIEKMQNNLDETNEHAVQKNTVELDEDDFEDLIGIEDCFLQQASNVKQLNENGEEFIAELLENTNKHNVAATASHSVTEGSQSQPRSSTYTDYCDSFKQIEDYLICTICPKSKKYKTEKGIKHHIKSHHFSSQYQCTECQYETNQYTDLRDHLLFYHKIVTERSVFRKMETNEVTNKRQSAYRQYYQNVENGYECNECQMTTKEQTNIVRHIKFKHLGEKKECKNCYKKFTSRIKFANHWENCPQNRRFKL